MDEIPAVIDDSLSLPPIDLTLPANAYADLSVFALVPVPRSGFAALKKGLTTLAPNPTAPQILSFRTPSDLLRLYQGAVTVTQATPIQNSAWASSADGESDLRLLHGPLPQLAPLTLASVDRFLASKRDCLCPATPITNPVSGESLVGTEPQLLQQVNAGWRHRLNLFTGRALSDTALDSEQLYRGGLLATSGLSVTAGIVNGLALTLDTSGADPVLSVSPGYGIGANGQDVVLNSPLKTTLSTLAVVDPVTGNTIVNAATANNLSFRQFAATPGNTTYAGILILQPVVAQVSGQSLDTGAGPIEVSGNLNASCDPDPDEYVFEDWQIADAVRLVFLPWPAGVAALPLPVLSPEATWRNRLAYTIFEAEALLGPDDQLPWSMLGVPVALIAFDPGIAWKASQAFTAGQFLTDPNGNIQVVQTAGTSAAVQPKTWNTVYGGVTTDGGVTWINSGLGWKPLFVDCNAVVRAGGLPRRRYVLPSQPPPAVQWQPNTPFIAGAFILDANVLQCANGPDCRNHRRPSAEIQRRLGTNHHGW